MMTRNPLPWLLHFILGLQIAWPLWAENPGDSKHQPLPAGPPRKFASSPSTVTRPPIQVLPAAFYRIQDLTQDWSLGCHYAFGVKVTRGKAALPTPATELALYLAIDGEEDILLGTLPGNLAEGQHQTFSVAVGEAWGSPLRRTPAKGVLNYGYKVLAYQASPPTQRCSYTVRDGSGQSRTIQAPCPGTTTILTNISGFHHRVKGVGASPYLAITAVEDPNLYMRPCWPNPTCSRDLSQGRDSTGALIAYFCADPGWIQPQVREFQLQSFAPAGAKVFIDSATITLPNHNGAVSILDAGAIPAALSAPGEKITIKVVVDINKLWAQPAFSGQFFGVVAVSGRCEEGGVSTPFNLLLLLGFPDPGSA